MVFLVFLVGAWWGTCVFCLRVKGHPFPPSLRSGSELIRTLETSSARASDDGTDQSAHATCGVGFGGEGQTRMHPTRWTYCFATREITYLCPSYGKAPVNSRVNQNMINSDKPIFFPCVLLPNERFHKIMGFRHFAAENRKLWDPQNLEFQPQNSSVLSPQ